jgi:hypothetical protein
VLALGPVPVSRVRTNASQADFTIAAEKCPNRLGVQAILAHFTGGVTTFDEFVGKVGRRHDYRCLDFWRLPRSMD